MKFIAVDLNGNVSNVRSETYTINDSQAPTAAANPVGGTYTNKTQVTLSATDNVDPNPSIYYTLDGSDPTTNSVRYSGPFYIPANFTNTLKFFAVDATGNTSPVQTETYNMIPDLLLSGVSVTTYPFYNNTVIVTVSNTNVVDLGTLNVNVQIGGYNTTVAVPGLVAGGSTTFTVTDNSKHQVGDIIPVTVTVDPENVIAESDETNNLYTTNTTIAVTGDRYNGGRFSVGQDLVNNTVYLEGNIGVRVLISGTYSSSYDVTSVTLNRTFSASDFNIPAGATILSARLYQGYSWYGDPGFVLQFNGHETQEAIAKYSDRINGQYAYDVTNYFNTTGDNTAILTSTNVLFSHKYAYYGTVLIVTYEDVNEPYRQIWVNEGSDCLLYAPATGYTMFDNVTTANVVSAQVIIVGESAESNDCPSISFNEQNITKNGTGGSDPSLNYFNVTNALQNGTNELGAPTLGYLDSYWNFSNAVLEVTKDLTAPTVTANPTSGVSNTSKTVTLTATDDYDTSPDIYYTLDGSTPTTSSALYTGPITIDATTSLKFIAVDYAGNISDVQTEVYTIDTVAPNVTASIGTGVFGNSQNVALTATDNVDTSPDIYYTTDGTTPTTGSTLYTGLISIGATTVLRFFAVDDAGNASSVESRTYTIDSTASTVTATPVGGLYNTDLSVVLKAEDNIDAHPSIYYTINGDTPTTSSTLYTGPVLISSTSILRFIAVDLFGNTSSVGSETYTIDKEAPTVTANPTSGTYNNAQTVTLTASDDLDSNPEIRYTTNGDTPTSTSILYGGPFSITSTSTLRFIALDDAGNVSGVQTETYNIEPVPVAQFTATPTTGTTPLQVQFTNQSTGTVTSYAWDFDNNGTTDSIIENPTYTYNTPGTYTIKLTVTGPGGSDEEIKTNYINVNEPAPVAQFTGTPNTGTTLLTVIFSNASTGNATNYAWDFDNNGTTDSTDTSPTWIYNTAGTYTVKLTATGPGGSDDEVKTDYVIVNEPVPVADFVGVSTSGTSPLTVDFTDQSTNTAEWAWDFNNDGTTDSTDTNPTWIYDRPGNYTVKLTVTGPGGSDEETKTDYITVNKSAQSDLLATEMKVTNSSYLNYSLVDVTITNIGLKTAGYFDVTLYDNGTKVGQQYALWLASEAVRTLSFIWSPSTIGEHNLKAVIDQNNNIEESNENNNQITQIFDNRPDLTPTGLKTNTLPLNYCYVTVDVTNKGEDLTEFYDVTLYDNGTQIGQQKIYGLRTGETKTVTFLTKLTTSSTHNLQATTDATSTIPETNENNNKITKTL